MFKKMSAFVLVAMAIALCMSGCFGKKKTLLQKIKEKGTITVYTNPEFPPYEYLGKDGAIVGAEMDLVNMIAEKLGVKANFVSSEFDSILMTVVTGKADMGASGFTINDERKQKVDFSIPFVVSVQYLIVPEDSPIKVVEDLAGKKIGGQQGTTGLMMIEDAINKGILQGKGSELKAYNTAPDAVVAMKENKLDAVVIDELVAKSLTTKNPGMKCFEMLTSEGKGLDAPEEFGIMLAKGNEDLMAIVDSVITEMKADGTLDALILKHMELTEAK